MSSQFLLWGWDATEGRSRLAELQRRRVTGGTASHGNRRGSVQGCRKTGLQGCSAKRLGMLICPGDFTGSGKPRARGFRGVTPHEAIPEKGDFTGCHPMRQSLGQGISRVVTL